MHSLGCLFQKEWRTTTLTIWGVWAGQPFLYWGTIILVTLIFSDTDPQDLKDCLLYTSDAADDLTRVVCGVLGVLHRQHDAEPLRKNRQIAELIKNKIGIKTALIGNEITNLQKMLIVVPVK